MTRKISIFGSTGSIGTQTLDIISKSKSGTFEVVGLSANSNYIKLAEQAIMFKAKFAAITDESKYLDLKNLLSPHKIQALSGTEGASELAALENDQIIAGISGSAGILSTYIALKKGTNVLFANKESLVCAGELLKKAAKTSGATLIPIDSEHNAIFQCIERTQEKSVNKIILTASGGPFLGYSREQLKIVTTEQALKHPNWVMGKKVTIDSATLFNKGLEIIEAHYLFNMPLEKIGVIVHPESTIHSMVNYDDGSTLAQLGQSDMRVPICYGLYWPERYVGPNIVKNLDFANLQSLHFEAPDHNSFPSLNLARKSLSLGQTFPMALNASNEIAVEAFLAKRIKFLDIFKIVETFLDKHKPQTLSNIDDLISLDGELKAQAQELVAMV